MTELFNLQELIPDPHRVRIGELVGVGKDHIFGVREYQRIYSSSFIQKIDFLTSP